MTRAGVLTHAFLHMILDLSSPFIRLSLTQASLTCRTLYHLFLQISELSTLLREISTYRACKDTYTETENSLLKKSHPALKFSFIFGEHLILSDQISSLSKSGYSRIRELRCNLILIRKQPLTIQSLPNSNLTVLSFVSLK